MTSATHHSQLARMAAIVLTIISINLTAAKAGGSKGHDFSDLYGTGPERCMPCHVDATEAGKTTVSAPSWEHSDESPIFTSFSISTKNGQVDEVSTLCLSCHDGITAPSTGGMSSVTSMRGPGIGDLAKSHPIGVRYPSLASETRTKYRRQPGGDIQLGKGEVVTCASCHDPHGSPNPKLLRETMRDSRLCFQCHDM